MSSPAWTASIAWAWWMYGRSIPRPASPARMRESSHSGHSPWTAVRAGTTSWWRTPRASDGSSSACSRTDRVGAGAYVRMLAPGLKQNAWSDCRRVYATLQPARDSSRVTGRAHDAVAHRESPRPPELTTRIRRSYPRDDAATRRAHDASRTRPRTGGGGDPAAAARRHRHRARDPLRPARRGPDTPAHRGPDRGARGRLGHRPLRPPGRRGQR